MSNVIESILHKYPYPIAKCYQRLVGASEIHERWNYSRYLIEVTLKFCACISVSRYLHNETHDEKTDAVLKCLTRPSLGHWINLMNRCAAQNQSLKEAFIEEGVFAPTRERPLMAHAHRAMQMYPDREDSGTPKNITISRFFEGFAAYRNRTVGHGAPSIDHIESITPILQEAAIDLLMHLEILQEVQLIYVDEIKLDRNSYNHSMLKLSGTSQIALPDYVTDFDTALIGHDKKLFLSEPGQEVPFVCVHPLAIYSADEVYLLHRSDVKRNVDYICHHTGQYYSADRIFEDFRSAFGSFIDGADSPENKYEPCDVYEETVRMSLVNGFISASEKELLVDLRSQLGLGFEDAEAIERKLLSEISDKSAISESESDKAMEGSTSFKDIESGEGRRVLFISYASVRSGFWADLVSRLAARTHLRGNIFSMVAPDPMNDYDAGAMANLIADMEQIMASHSPDLILLVPYPSSTFTSLFESRFRKFKVPVLTLDTEFKGMSSLPESSFRAPPAIHVDNLKGGELAAKHLLEATNTKNENARFLVMPGLDDAAHSIARVEGFKTFLEKNSPSTYIRELPEGQFSRKKAQKVFEDFLEDVDLSRYHGIFCGNDDMALGVYQVVVDWYKNNDANKVFHIVGFNNTVEFQSVKTVDTHGILLGSIDQSLDEYIGFIFQTVDELLASKPVSDLTLVEPNFAN